MPTAQSPNEPRAARARDVSVRVPVMEVFASIQGEGLYAGDPQVFLRLAGCPLRCRWCDTPGSWPVPAEDGSARVRPPRLELDSEPDAGASLDRTERPDAWASPFQAALWIGATEPGEPRTVSVTGGEPLMWPEFLLALRGFLGERRVHLETAGAHPASLERVLEVVDHVSLDLKLEGDLDPPVPLGLEGEEPSPRTAEEWSAARRACMALVAERDACTKLVVSGGRSARDFEPLLLEQARTAPDLPLFLQPVTPMSSVPAPGEALLTSLVEMARDLRLDVRVVPQLHRTLRLP